jgi:UDP-N-acetylmuramoyl-L-alanyl-D-glutamate--2,6-diaminopimelate ligase
MEVSSHALVQSRVEGIHFDLAVFTNLSHDHLDYHGSMEEYFKAKSSLFTPDHALRAVVNADDASGQELLRKRRIPMVAVHHTDASDIVLRPGRTEFTWREQRVVTPLTGAINVDNALLAAEAALAIGLDPSEIAVAFSLVSPPPGRLEVISAPPALKGVGPESPPFTVIVDYAHTPAGLEVVLGEARGLTENNGRVLVVFGCGGNRDRAKRPKMGRVRKGFLSSSPTGTVPSGAYWTRRAPETWWSSPERVTRRTRRSGQSVCPSMTGSRRVER